MTSPTLVAGAHRRMRANCRDQRTQCVGLNEWMIDGPQPGRICTFDRRKTGSDRARHAWFGMVVDDHVHIKLLRVVSDCFAMRWPDDHDRAVLTNHARG